METLHEMKKKASPRVLGFCVSREVIDLELRTLSHYTHLAWRHLLDTFQKAFNYIVL